MPLEFREDELAWQWDATALRFWMYRIPSILSVEEFFSILKSAFLIEIHAMWRYRASMLMWRMKWEWQSSISLIPINPY